MHPELIEYLKKCNNLSLNEKYNLIGINKILDESGKIKIPEYIKQIKLDIGLSFSAPNSSLWLQETEDRMVFGFEPNPVCLAALHQGVGGRQINLNQSGLCISENAIHKNGEVTQTNINDRFKLLSCALDDIETGNPKFMPFYMTSGDPGCSSLSVPTENLPHEIKHGNEGMKVTGVIAISLSDILDKIPWNRYEFIEQVKIDTQGRDLNVLKGAKEYLQKIVFLQVENSTNGEYEHSHTKEEIHQFLIDNDFKHISTIGVDSSYINKKYDHLAGDLHNSVV